MSFVSQSAVCTTILSAAVAMEAQELHYEEPGPERRCWGYIISGGTTCCTPGFKSAMGHFKNKLCPACKSIGLKVEGERAFMLVIPDGTPADAYTNPCSHGCWSEKDGVHYRIVNQTKKCKGWPFVLLKDATARPNGFNLHPVPSSYLLESGHLHLVVSGGTLRPSTLVPSAYQGLSRDAKAPTAAAPAAEVRPPGPITAMPVAPLVPPPTILQSMARASSLSVPPASKKAHPTVEIAVPVASSPAPCGQPSCTACSPNAGQASACVGPPTDAPQPNFFYCDGALYSYGGDGELYTFVPDGGHAAPLPSALPPPPGSVPPPPACTPAPPMDGQVTPPFAAGGGSPEPERPPHAEPPSQIPRERSNFSYEAPHDQSGLVADLYKIIERQSQEIASLRQVHRSSNGQAAAVVGTPKEAAPQEAPKSPAAAPPAKVSSEPSEYPMQTDVVTTAHPSTRPACVCACAPHAAPPRSNPVEAALRDELESARMAEAALQVQKAASMAARGREGVSVAHGDTPPQHIGGAMAPGAGATLYNPPPGYCVPAPAQGGHGIGQPVPPGMPMGASGGPPPKSLDQPPPVRKSRNHQATFTYDHPKGQAHNPPWPLAPPKRGRPPKNEVWQVNGIWAGGAQGDVERHPTGRPPADNIGQPKQWNAVAARWQTAHEMAAEVAVGFVANPMRHAEARCADADDSAAFANVCPPTGVVLHPESAELNRARAHAEALQEAAARASAEYQQLQAERAARYERYDPNKKRKRGTPTAPFDGRRGDLTVPWSAVRSGPEQSTGAASLLMLASADVDAGPARWGGNEYDEYDGSAEGVDKLDARATNGAVVVSAHHSLAGAGLSGSRPAGYRAPAEGVGDNDAEEDDDDDDSEGGDDEDDDEEDGAPGDEALMPVAPSSASTDQVAARMTTSNGTARHPTRA